MICPHCRETIREEERYLMARSPDDEMVWTPGQRKAAAYLLLFVILTGLLFIVGHIKV